MIKVHVDKIKLVPVDEIKLNKKNRNKHPEHQLVQLTKLIEYQGFRQPLTVSNRTGLLVAGHGRLQVAKTLGMAKVPVSFQDFVDEAQEYAYGVSDNAIQQQSLLDFEGINLDLPDFGPDFDVDWLGIKNFSVDVADKLIDHINRGDETSEWTGMPDFVVGEKEIKLTIVFQNSDSRAVFVDQHGLKVTSQRENQWLIRY